MTGGSSALQADGPEFELLLDSARPPSATGGPPPIPDALDWSRLLERALDQGMVPLLFRRLEAGGWERVPWRVREWLTGRQEETRRRNRFLTTELLALLDRLTDERIECHEQGVRGRRLLVRQFVEERRFSSVRIADERNGWNRSLLPAFPKL